MCGEKPTCLVMPMGLLGSPPRVRGKVELHHQDQTHVGITPACAGKSDDKFQHEIPIQDHPRVCGEKLPRKYPNLWEDGSPPRVRGKETWSNGAGHLRRITPACAGKSRGPPRCPRQGTDHPRVCGEKMQSYTGQPSSSGSPPRVRGKAVHNASKRRHTGITPACAGKRQEREGAAAATRDHPRVCGEKPISLGCNRLRLGSPPRVRGKEMADIKLSWEERITPACAGKSIPSFFPLCLIWDHPRVCGEKQKICAYLHHAIGSPPRVRGKGHRDLRIRERPGITPACAGKSFRCCSKILCYKDHPRVCGEKCIRKRTSLKEKGSPPRVRGKDLSASPKIRKRRITPACAGKSCPRDSTSCRTPDHPRVCGEKRGKRRKNYAEKGSPPRVRGKAP